MSSPSRFTKSVFWLFAFSGLGYAILLGSTKSDEEYKKIRKEYPGTNTQAKEFTSKNQRFMNVLESASSSKKPIYRLNKEDIEKTLDK